MKFAKYISKSSQLFVENRLLKFILVVLVLLLAYTQINMIGMTKNQQTVLIPLGLTEQIELGESHIDREYINAMGTYIATLMYSTTPLKVEPQYRILTDLFEVSAYNRYAEQLLSTAAAHKKNQISQTLSINAIEVIYEPKQQLIVDVEVMKYVFGKQSEDGATKHRLVIDFVVKNSRFQITDIDEIKR